MKKHLRDLIAGAKQGIRTHQAGERLDPVQEMIACIRLAHRWRAEAPDRAAIVQSIAEAWAKDAVQ